ncbi:MAG: RHS repeat-associated core domain-containing protein [Spirochaetaceae bacterium]|nr:RHS repeat-associated core domain-containing protein [Spirochaetaceae bacterium]
MKGNGFKKIVFVFIFAALAINVFAFTISFGGGKSFSISSSGMSYKNESNPSKSWSVQFGKGKSENKNQHGGGGRGFGNSDSDSDYDPLGEVDSAVESAKGGLEAGNSRNKNGTAKTGAENTAMPAGDPVLLTTGRYFQNETDISLKTLGGAYNINRYYISSHKTAGKTCGSEWVLSTETRIIRGYTDGAEEAFNNVQKTFESAGETLTAAEKSFSDFTQSEDYESTVAPAGEDETEEEAEERLEELRKTTEAISIGFSDMKGSLDSRKEKVLAIKAVAEKARKIKSFNKYSSYGEASKNEATGNGTLILVIDGYIPIVFDYKGSGSWESSSAKYKNTYSLKSKNGCDSAEADGFILKTKDGSSVTFNKWGLIEKITDRNGSNTLFVRGEHQKLTEIKSDNGVQSLKFTYNAQNLLEKIELYDDTKETGYNVTYTYEGNLLKSVTDTDGDESRFEYNADKNLVKLVKSDGSFVEFKYGLTDKDGNLLTTQTVNEEGFAERFDYNRTGRITTYTDHDGVTTVYKYDDNQQITEQNFADGTVIKTTYNAAGNVLTQTVNGSETKYVYDGKDNLLKIQYADGSSENFTYDNNNNCIKAVDRDGITTEFRYDTKGNCTGILRGGIEAVSATYDSKGLVTGISRNGGNVTGKASFVYDGRGNVVSKSVYTNTGVINESWSYDEQNRVTEYTDGEGQKYTYSYTQKTVIEKTPAGLERTYTTNGRKDLVKIEETDTKTGEKRIFAYEYDKRHLVTAVKAGTKPDDLQTVVSYTYTKAGKALSETRKDGNNSWITEYVYDTAGRIESVKRSKTDKYGQALSQPIKQKYEYTNTADGMDFTSVSPEGNRTVVSYDRWNRVTDVKNALNEKSHRSLSSAGRTVMEESGHGGIYSYGYDKSGNLSSLGEQGKKQAKVTYNPDGSIRSVTDRLGNVTTFEYDERGLLIREISPSSTTVYSYDNVGRIKTVLVGSLSNLTKANSTQYVEYEYSDAGRNVKVLYGELYETNYTLNAWGEVIEVTDGMGNSRKYDYDSIGRTKAAYDGYGSKYEYAYNAIGRVSTLTAPDGSKKTYEYNELYLVTKAIDGEGIIFEGTYNRDGLLIAEKARPGVNKEYRYDKLGRIVEVKTGGEVTERYSYTTKGRTVTFTDGKGSDYVYSYDEFGRLVAEKNRLDGVQNYTYNDNGELKAKKDFEGNVSEILFDERTRTERTKYADGTETVIIYDECGNILSATNESGTLSYVYDKAGLLVKETDEKTGETVNYTYDKAGRRTRLISKERDISYGYGKNGELLTQKDRLKQLSVSYKYDVCGREKERRFGNGVKQLTFYDKAGRTVCIKQINSSDKLLSGEAYVYDKTGRRSLTVNDKGLVTIYKYDNQSRLETVFYPFNEDIKETARKEADKQGLYFLPSQGNAENYFLSSGELMQVRAAAEYIAGGRSGAVTVNQVVWKESYTYDANGNRTSKTTSWGTVAYSYDKENRLVESGDLGKSESVKYTYDKNGNLLRESAARYRKDYTYNAQNRMSFSDVQDSVLNTRNFTEYEYDAFGRRIETRQYLGDYTRNLYDGFSFDIIGKSALQGSYPMALPEQKYRTPNRQSATSVNGSGISPSGRNERGTDIGTRYRYIDENPLVPIQESGTNSSTSTSTSKTRSRPNSEYVLYSYGEPVALSVNGNASYFGTDILGSVRSVTDKYGSVQADYSYDVFGSPYLGNLENDIGFGYCGKVYDIGTGLYDYGFRDYSPASARFTTIDPIRDGSNWFSYVVNDPVNYVDPLGLKATDYGASDSSPRITFSSGTLGKTSYGFTLPEVKSNDFNFRVSISSKSGNNASTLNSLLGVLGKTTTLIGFVTDNPSLTLLGSYLTAPSKGDYVYKKLSDDSKKEVSSMDMYYMYRSGQGRDVTLSELGLLDTIQKAVESGRRNTVDKIPIQQRFFNQMKKGDGSKFENSYQFVWDKFAIGNAKVSGVFNGTYKDNGNGTFHFKGSITYTFEDVFTDPYDLKDIIPGNWNPDGEPYKITDKWTVNIDGDY